MSRNLLIILLLMFVVACSTSKKRINYREMGFPILSNSSDPSFQIIYSSERYNYWINYYSKRTANSTSLHIKNAMEVHDVVAEILRQEGVPSEVFYLGLMESGYNLEIKSVKGAAGPWQFMKNTARAYGLVVDRAVDERYSIYKSTRAAAKYLNELYKTFNSWELALCAYNSGPKRIFQAIKEANSSDYFIIASGGFLPDETLNYIPKMVAIREVFLNHNKYPLIQVPLNSEHSIFTNVDRVDVSSSSSFGELAKNFGIESEEILRKLNPEFLHGKIVRSKTGRQRIFVPQSEETFDNSRKPYSIE